MATRKTTNLPARDLTAGVNDADYLASVQAVWDGAKHLAREYGWCSSWVGYIRNISQVFPVSRSVTTVELPATVTVPRDSVNSGTVDLDAANAEDLRAIRGGIFYYVQAGHIRLEEANAVLSAAGLVPYVPEVPARDDWYAYLPTFHFSVPSGTDRGDVRNMLAEVLATVTDTDSVTVNRELSNQGSPDLYQNSPRTDMVPDSEVIAPRHG